MANVNGGSGNDVYGGTAGTDILNGNLGNDTLDGGDGRDSLFGGGDNDLLYGGNGNDYVFGGTGNDVLYGDNLVGAGADTLNGDSGDDSIFGGGGADSAFGGDGLDWIVGGLGDDRLEGGNDADTLDAGDGNDRLYGGDGADLIYAGIGNDNADGGSGADWIELGDGNDLGLGGTGDDSIFGGYGNDTVDGGGDHDFAEGGQGDDRLSGGVGNDSLYGGDGIDSLMGNAGEDELTGGDGNDRLYGGDDNDTLAGGAGNDGLYGGLGWDTAVFALGAADVTIIGDPNVTATAISAEGIDILVSIEDLVFLGDGNAFVYGDTQDTVVEDGDLTAGGDLEIVDGDAGEASFQVASDNASFGNWSVDANGTWAYTLNNAAVQSLDDGDTTLDTFVINSADGTDTTITITIHGTEDAPSISGSTADTVVEDGDLTAGGDLDITDADAGEASFQATAGTATFGDWSVGANGTWSYTLDNAAVQGLGQGDTTLDTFVVDSADGTGTTITITVNGTNDAPSITGSTADTVVEDGDLTAGGDLDITDADTGEGSFQAVTAGTASFGDWSVDADGTWAYTLDNGAVQGLGQGDTTLDTFVVDSDDGTDTTITVTIHGTNDAPSITGSTADTVVEDGDLTAGGDLDISDADTGEASFVAATGTATLGNWSVGTNGTWSYTLDNAAAQDLTQGESTIDTFVVDSADGTDTTITVTVHGANDGATITGVTADTVVEDGDLTAGGDLDITDSDVGDESFQATSAGATFGDWSVDADGTWAYTLNNGAVQGLGAGDTTLDTFVIDSADGTDTTITITIHGTNDTPTITGPTADTVIEDNDLTAGGDLNITDTDVGEGVFQAVTAGTASFGDWSVDAGGTWSYTLDNGAVQGLGQGDTTLDTFVVESADGTDTTITVTIHGTNDAPVISGTTADTVVEDGDLTAGGQLTITDADTGEASFQTVTAGAASYGNWAVDSDGTWQYTLDNADTDVQNLSAGGTLVDTFIVDSADGTDTTISITIHGADDGPPVDANDFDFENDNNTVGDRLEGSSGNDSLDGGNGDDVIYGAAGRDTVMGNNHDDLLFGGSGNDTVLGGNDADILYGGSGNDTLDGENGNDTLIGGFGSDSLIGGGGVDLFYYLSRLDAGDTFTDFDTTTESIFFEDAAFSGANFTGPGGALVATDFATITGGGVLPSATATEHFIYNSTDDILYYNHDGAGAGAAEVIARFTNNPTITAADIFGF
jgi:VCBS repeat-containing protein